MTSGTYRVQNRKLARRIHGVRALHIGSRTENRHVEFTVCAPPLFYVRVQSVDYPVRSTDSRDDDESDLRGLGDGVSRDGSGVGGYSPTGATVTLTQLPVLGHFREGLVVIFALFDIVVKFVALVGLLYLSRTSGTNEYGVLPDESRDIVPSSLVNQEDQEGVTIAARGFIYFQADSTYNQRGLTFWTPFQPTCGCSEFILAFFAATIPVVVEYEQCYPWAEDKR